MTIDDPTASRRVYALPGKTERFCPGFCLIFGMARLSARLAAPVCIFSSSTDADFLAFCTLLNAAEFF